MRVELLLFLFVFPLVFVQSRAPIEIDPNTGRAIGAKEMSPKELHDTIDKKTDTLVIDVREPEEFEKETIKGAINIPLRQLEVKLTDIPKGTTLVFT